MGEVRDKPDDPPLRVCFVSRKWPPAMGGIETYAAELAQELDVRTELRTIVLPGRADGTVPGALALLAFGLRAAWRIATARHPATVTHVADMASWPLALVARMRAPESRIVLSAHGTDLSYAGNPGLKGGLYRTYLALAARLLPDIRVIANSRATAELARTLGFAQVRAIPLATTLRPPDPIPAQSRRLLFAGRIIPSKGLGWFVREVLPRLPEDITLDVAGTIWNTGEARALEAPRVQYLGRLAPEDLARAYAGALAVVAPNVPVDRSNFEGFGLVAAEAAAAGGVAVVADYFGLADAVEDGVTGWLLPPGDADAWAEALTRVAGWSPDERVAFTARAGARAQAHFAWARVALETLEVYRWG